MSNSHEVNLGTPTPSVLEVYRGIIYDEPSNRILMMQRSLHDSYKPGYYEFPGGKVDPGEDGLTALRREIEEETGLFIEPLAGSMEQSEIYVEEQIIERGFYTGFQHISHFIVSRVIGGDFKMSKEHINSVWDNITVAPSRNPVTVNSGIALRRLQELWKSSNS
jgi:8-oxo-dGTP pyrophosphatase MutT (NUDIX family)